MSIRPVTLLLWLLHYSKSVSFWMSLSVSLSKAVSLSLYLPLSVHSDESLLWATWLIGRCQDLIGWKLVGSSLRNHSQDFVYHGLKNDRLWYMSTRKCNFCNFLGIHHEIGTHYNKGYYPEGLQNGGFFFSSRLQYISPDLYFHCFLFIRTNMFYLQNLKFCLELNETDCTHFFKFCVVSRDRINWEGTENKILHI